MAAPGDFPPGYLTADKGPQALAIIITFPILATAVVCFRMFTRVHIVNNPSWDDWSMVVALIFAIGTAICQGLQVKNGMGRHMASLTQEQGITSLKALFASIIFYNFSLTAIKVSIVLQYLRIAVDRRVRLACHILMGIVAVNCVQTLLTGIWTCNPVPKFWDDSIRGSCVNKPALWFANAGINICTDIWLIVLPIFILRKMILRWREKASLILILGLGGFASVASVLRLHAMYIVSISRDITWDNPGTATWSTMELNIGIICASLPTLRALISKIFPRAFKSSLAVPKNGYHGVTPGKGGHTSENEFGIEEQRGNIIIKTDIALEEHARHSGTSPSSTSSEAPVKRPW